MNKSYIANGCITRDKIINGAKVIKYYQGGKV